jgi:hypothetical protein
VNAHNVFDAASAFRARALAATRKMTNARARAGSSLVTREGQWRGCSDRSARLRNGACQWRFKAPERERELRLAREADKRVKRESGLALTHHSIG